MNIRPWHFKSCKNPENRVGPALQFHANLSRSNRYQILQLAQLCANQVPPRKPCIYANNVQNDSHILASQIRQMTISWRRAEQCNALVTLICSGLGQS